MTIRQALGVLSGLLLMMSASARLSAHVGSPDVYFEGSAGPYRLLVAVRTPVVVPGVADIEVRVLGGPLPREVRVVPLRLTGPGAVFAPVADRATRSDADPRFFTAGLWMMVTGPWQVRINVDGDAGGGQVSVPVDALASRTLHMDARIALVLIPLGLFLVLGFVALVGASVGQAQIEPGTPVPAARVRRARLARVLAFTLAILVVVFGNWWWSAEANAYDLRIYKPLELHPGIDADGSLRVALRDPGWLGFRLLDDLVPDHGHTMHLFAVRTPALDRLLHLHPRQADGQDPGSFVERLPVNPAGAGGGGGGGGSYRLFADVVHANGLAETAVADATLPNIADAALTGDDSVGLAPSVGAFEPDRVVALLPDGGRMTWERESGALRAKRPYLLAFRVDDRDGSPAQDMALYMGMPGHAIILRRDLNVFAHVHPSGTAPMASIALAQHAAGMGGLHAQQTGNMAAHDAQHAGNMAALPATVTFPYGFPRAGEYRLFVQVKRSAGVETGVFDVRVAEP